MKSIMNKKLILVAIIAFLGFSTASAQKIAHVDVVALVNAMPEKISADEKMKSDSDAKKAEIEKMETALKAKVEVLQKKYAAMPEAELKKSEEQYKKDSQSVQEEAKKIEEFRNDAAKLLGEKSNQLYEPIQKKVLDAITKVATTKGFEYVIDSSTQVLLVANGYDLMNDMKKELGIIK